MLCRMQSRIKMQRTSRSQWQSCWSGILLTLTGVQLLGPSHRSSQQCSSQPSWSSICAEVDMVDCSGMLSHQLRMNPKLSAHPKSPILIRTLPEAQRHIQAEEYEHVWSVRPARRLAHFHDSLQQSCCETFTLWTAGGCWRGRHCLLKVVPSRRWALRTQNGHYGFPHAFADVGYSKPNIRISLLDCLSRFVESFDFCVPGLRTSEPSMTFVRN